MHPILSKNLKNVVQYYKKVDFILMYCLKIKMRNPNNLAILYLFLGIINIFAQNTNLLDMYDRTYVETICIPTYNAWSADNCVIPAKVSPYWDSRSCWINDACEIKFTIPVNNNAVLEATTCVFLGSLFGEILILCREKLFRKK